MPRSSAADAAVTRAAVLDAALQEFADVGYERATMRSISRRASFTPGAIYAHFPSKMALFHALMDRWESHFRPVLAEVADSQMVPEAALSQLIRELLLRDRDDTEFRLLLRILIHNRELVARRSGDPGGARVQRIRDVVARVLSRLPGSTEESISREAAILTAFLRGLTYQSLLDDDGPRILDDHLDETVNIVVQGILFLHAP